jgi:hypothetical protein
MKTYPLMQTLITMLALEWELCSQDPVVFCYRISVNLRGSSSGDTESACEGSSCGGCNCLS